MKTTSNGLCIALLGSILVGCGGGGDEAAEPIDAKAAIVCRDWNEKPYVTPNICVARGDREKTYYMSTWYTENVKPESGDYNGWRKPTADEASKLVYDPNPPVPPELVLTPAEDYVAPKTGGRQIGAYYTQWSRYQREFYVGDVDTQTAVNGSKVSVADQLTFINYGFGNIYQKNNGYECDMVHKEETGGGDGGDRDADYRSVKPEERTINRSAVPADAKLAGNFGQLRLLKQKHPHLKLFISLGGWTWSKHFSNAAKTQSLREQLVRSCVKQYIVGDLPLTTDWGTRGGPGSLKGVFDGIDIDWEFPGVQGMEHNALDVANDRQNFSLLMAEFRKQLTAQGARDGKTYLLTAAIGAGADKIDKLDLRVLSEKLDWINVMSYDYHGGFENTRTDFHAPLDDNPNDPLANRNKRYNIRGSVAKLMADGLPANKIVLGVPFYGRGWTGVPKGPGGDGLYQSVTGSAKNFFGELGAEDYKRLKVLPGVKRYNEASKQWSVHASNGDWWSYDGPESITAKMKFAREQKLLGAFAWSLDGDDRAELSSAMYNGLKD